MEELQADVCAIQETRLRLPEDFEVKDLECVHSPAVKGNGGLLIMVRKHPRIKILSYKRICHRILVANLQIDGRRFKIVACHAPVRDAPESHHIDFQSQLAPQLQHIPPQDFLVVCADLNARMGQLGQEFIVVGPWTSPIKGSSHVLRLLDACQKNESVNNAVATWKKASAPSVVSPPRFQIDYIMGNRLLFEATQYCQPLPWAQMDALHESDHRPVLLQAVLHGHDPKSAKKGRPLLRRFVNEDHQAEFDKVFRATLKDIEKKEKFQIATVFEKVQLIQHVALTVVQNARPDAQLVVRNPWVSKQAMAALTRLNHLRRVIAALKQRRFRQAKRLLKVFDDVNSDFLRSLTLEQAVNWLNEEVTLQLKMTRTCLKACKRQWVDRQCQSVSDDLAAHDSWKAYRTIKATCGRAKKPGGYRLALEDGTVTMDEKVVDKQWTDYWLSHFSATGSNQNSFMHTELDQVQQHDDTLRVTVEEVLAVLKTLRAKKATPNVLSGEGWLRIYDEMAEYLAAAINQIVTNASQLGAMSGLKCSSFRPIQLVTSERKTLGKLLLEKIRPVMDNDPAQFCIGSAAGTALPVFALNQILAQARTENKSSAVLFLDIKAAYDCVIQELVLPESENDEAVVCALVKLGLEDAQARSSLAYIRAHPSALVNSELPPALRAILANWMKDSWSILAREWQRERQSYMPDEAYLDQRHGADRILELFHHSAPFAPQTVQTDRGIKQGDSLSTWLFCGLFKIVLNHSMKAFSRTGLQECSMPTWPVPSLKGDTTSVPKCFTRIDRLGYADDVGISLMDKDASRLLRAVEALMKACHESFKAFGFQLNYKKGKSALMLRLTGRDAKGIWQHVKHCSHSELPLCTDFGDSDDSEVSDVERDSMDAAVKVAGAEAAKDLCIYVDHDIPLQVCTRYIYLGSWVTSQMNLMKEVRVRKAAAIKSLNTHASILTSVALSIHQRLSLCKTLCVCHLLQQLQLIARLSKSTEEGDVNVGVDVHQLQSDSLLKRTCRLDQGRPHHTA
eukprot:539769-Amphidinium_carterae.2